VFAAQTAQSARERLVIVAETRLRDAAELARLQRDTQALATQLLGEPADDVLLLPPHSVLKTSSGKIRRAALRERYEAGQLGDSSSALWLQLARVALSAGWRTAQRWGRRGVAVIYALYALSVFALLVPGVWLGVIVLPRPSQRWRLIRAAIRGLRRAAGVKLRLKQHGAHGDQQVFVANHASYIDVLALIEVLPGQPVYVAKREFEDHWFTRWFLQRLDTVFVERFDLRRSAAEPQRFVQALNAGHSLMFFPEGTFRAEPGLLPFRMGAFLAAAEAGAPIRAVALAGAREILRAGERLPRHGLIDIHLSEPIRPVGNDWDAALGLREQARAFIAEHCGETDLDAGR
jgi:1-acyl-sn-glycerol-3-phosphate acyltransferase